jgi:hypothetical protein
MKRDIPFLLKDLRDLRMGDFLSGNPVGRRSTAASRLRQSGKTETAPSSVLTAAREN